MNPYETYTKEERIAYKTQTREIFKVEAINEDKTVTIEYNGSLYTLDSEREMQIGDDWLIILSNSMTSIVITYIGFTRYIEDRNSFAFPIKLGICYLHGEAKGYDGVSHFYFKFVDKVDYETKSDVDFDSIKEIVDTSLVIKLRSNPDNPIVGLFVNKADIINNLSGIFPGYETNVTANGEVSYILRTAYFSPFLIVEYKDGRKTCYIHKGISVDAITEQFEEDNLLRI